MFKIIKSYRNLLLPILLLFILTLIIFIPATGIKFSWVDDGRDIQMCQQFIDYAKNLNFSNFFNLFFEKGNGRFRPVYWFWLIFSYLIGGNNPTTHYLLRFILIFATSFLIFKTVFLITKSKWAGFFSGALFLINPINTENWYRLGPQEPILGFFLIASIFLLLRGKNNWFPLLFLLLALLSKETALALLPAIIVLYLGKRFFLKKRDLILEKYLIFGLVFFGAMILVTTPMRSGYSQSYAFNPSLMLHSFLVYIKISLENLEPFFIIFILAFFFRMGVLFKRLKFKLFDNITLLEIFFGFWYFGFLVIQSPWKYILPRYMLPATIGLVVFMGIELSQLNIILKKRKNFFYKTAVLIFSGLLILFLSVNLVGSVNFGRRTSHLTNHVQKMVKYLAENVSENGKIFINFAKGEGTIELVAETATHFGLFYNRPDLKVDYLDLSNLPEGPYFVVSGTSAPQSCQEEIIEKQLAIRPKVEIKSEGEVPVITTPSNLIKQAIKKAIGLIFYKEKFTLEGIYTPYYLRDYWRIYYVES